MISLRWAFINEFSYKDCCLKILLLRIVTLRQNWKKEELTLSFRQFANFSNRIIQKFKPKWWRDYVNSCSEVLLDRQNCYLDLSCFGSILFLTIIQSWLTFLALSFRCIHRCPSITKWVSGFSEFLFLYSLTLYSKINFILIFKSCFTAYLGNVSCWIPFCRNFSFIFLACSHWILFDDNAHN